MLSVTDLSLRHSYSSHTWVLDQPGDFQSGAAVYHLLGKPQLRAKIAAVEDIIHPDLGPCAEAERLQWLAKQQVPCPEVVDSGISQGHEYLVTTMPTGRLASRRWPETSRMAIIDALADFARALHCLPTSQCPFDQRLRVTVPRAQEAAALGEIDTPKLPWRKRRWSRAQLACELVAQAQRVGREEPAVCHGSFRLSNVMLDLETPRVTGLVDVPRLGVADRYCDVAIMTRSINQSANAGFRSAHRGRFMYRYGERPIDGERLVLYRLLDDFT